MQDLPQNRTKLIQLLLDLKLHLKKLSARIQWERCEKEGLVARWLAEGCVLCVLSISLIVIRYCCLFFKMYLKKKQIKMFLQRYRTTIKQVDHTHFLAIPNADFKIRSVRKEVVLNCITFESLFNEASSLKSMSSSSESYLAWNCENI